MKKTSVFQNSLIWFGAGVSIAEILTGTYFAPLGMAKGFAAILLGHLIGCTMMFFAGLIGGRTGLSAMETSKLSFGKKGSLWFAALHGSAKAEGIILRGHDTVAAKEDDLAHDKGQHEQQHHNHLVDAAQVGQADQNPDQDQCADNKAPQPGGYGAAVRADPCHVQGYLLWRQRYHDRAG